MTLSEVQGKLGSHQSECQPLFLSAVRFCPQAGGGCRNESGPVEPARHSVPSGPVPLVVLDLFLALQDHHAVAVIPVQIVIVTTAEGQPLDAAGSIVIGAGQTVGLEPVEPVDERAESPIEAAATVELEAEVQSAITRLSPKMRAITVLRYMQGLSYEEISISLGISLGTVKSRLARAHQALDRELTPLLDRHGLR